jgi:nucleotide-binding universal stress UspA family protein
VVLANNNQAQLTVVEVIEKIPANINIPASILSLDKIEADIVVMGAVARSGISGFFMGNTAEIILNRIDCSVLAVKPPGFVTPVTLDK